MKRTLDMDTVHEKRIEAGIRPVRGVCSTGSGACPDAEQLAALVDLRLHGEDQANVERHVAACPICREVLAETVWLGQADPAVSGIDVPTGPLAATDIPWAQSFWSRAMRTTR